MWAPFCFPLESGNGIGNGAWGRSISAQKSTMNINGGIVRHWHAPPSSDTVRLWLRTTATASNLGPDAVVVLCVWGGVFPVFPGGYWYCFYQPDEGLTTWPRASRLGHLCSWCVFNFILFGISCTKGEVNHGIAAAAFFQVLQGWPILMDQEQDSIATLWAYVCRCVFFVPAYTCLGQKSDVEWSGVLIARHWHTR